MNIHEFIQKWSRVALTERSASQQHFLDLCEVLGHTKPAEADPKGLAMPTLRAGHAHALFGVSSSGPPSSSRVIL